MVSDLVDPVDKSRALIEPDARPDKQIGPLHLVRPSNQVLDVDDCLDGHSAAPGGRWAASFAAFSSAKRFL